jgi:hypothetical protein
MSSCGILDAVALERSGRGTVYNIDATGQVNRGWADQQPNSGEAIITLSALAFRQQINDPTETRNWKEDYIANPPARECHNILVVRFPIFFSL